MDVDASERLDAISELPRPPPTTAAERAPRASTFARAGHTLNDVTKSGRAVSASIFERSKVKAKEAPPNLAWEEDDRVMHTTSAFGLGELGSLRSARARLTTMDFCPCNSTPIVPLQASRTIRTLFTHTPTCHQHHHHT